jgi:hypothetical protein
MANEREPKYFIIPFNGRGELVRATTKARAVKGLFREMMAQAEQGARLATPDELVKLVAAGTKPIDVTEPEGAGNAGEGAEGANAPGATAPAALTGGEPAPATPAVTTDATAAAAAATNAAIANAAAPAHATADDPMFF